MPVLGDADHRAALHVIDHHEAAVGSENRRSALLGRDPASHIQRQMNDMCFDGVRFDRITSVGGLVPLRRLNLAVTEDAEKQPRHPRLPIKDQTEQGWHQHESKHWRYQQPANDDASDSAVKLRAGALDARSEPAKLSARLSPERLA